MSVSRDLRESITRTLSPYLNPRNFQVSVAAKLNADKTQTSETVYDPDKRANAACGVTKEKLNSQNSAGASPAGVQANLPKTQSSSGDNKQSSDQTDKKEELTNYEVSSKQTTVVSQGFTVKGLSVALLVNRAALAATLGDKPEPAAIDKAVKDIEALAGRPPGSTRRAATRSRSPSSISPTPRKTWSRSPARRSWRCSAASSEPSSARSRSSRSARC